MAIDWDDALACSTVKLARVQDKRLGILHYSFTLAILGYIVVGVMYVDKDYLLKEAPQGTVRVGLLPPAPDYQAQATALPYCTGYTGPEVPGLLMPTPFECRYTDAQFSVNPQVEQRGVFAATRITETQQTQEDPACTPAGENPLPDPSCYNWCGDACTNTTYYVAQIEDFTAFIDHTMVRQTSSLPALQKLSVSLPRVTTNSGGLGARALAQLALGEPDRAGHLRRGRQQDRAVRRLPGGQLPAGRAGRDGLPRHRPPPNAAPRLGHIRP